MKRILYAVLLLGGPFLASGQNTLSPFFKAQLDLYYLQQISNAVKNVNIANGSITSGKLSPSLVLAPDRISGVALTKTNSFSGTNISGPFNALVITGFYLDTNPSNFVTKAASEAFTLGQGFIKGADVPSFETDPFITGLTVTHTWFSATGAVPNAVTNVQVYSKGLLKSWTVNGAALP